MYWHLTLSSDGRFPIVSDEAARLHAVRTLARIIPQDMALFCVVDDHDHLVLRGERPRAGLLGRSVRLALGHDARGRLEPARIRPVESRSHMLWLVRYVLTQAPHHGLPTHPALCSGSCFLDLVGARVIPGFTLCLGEVLPRLQRSELYRIVGLGGEVQPAPDELVRARGAVRLRDAARAALALGPDPDGRTPCEVSARRAVAALGLAARLSANDLAWALRVPLRTIGRLARGAVPPQLARAIRLRLALEDAVARAGERTACGAGSGGVRAMGQ